MPGQSFGVTEHPPAPEGVDSPSLRGTPARASQARPRACRRALAPARRRRRRGAAGARPAPVLPARGLQEPAAERGTVVKFGNVCELLPHLLTFQF